MLSLAKSTSSFADMALANALNESHGDDSDFSDFDSSQDGSDSTDNDDNASASKAGHGSVKKPDKDEESHKSVDTSILRPQNEALHHDVPAMLKIIQGVGAEAISTDHRIGLSDWDLLWRCSYAAITSSSAVDRLAKAREGAQSSTNHPNQLRSSHSAEADRVTPVLKYKNFFSSESAKANFENELSTFSVATRPVSSPEKRPVRDRNFDPKHAYAEDIASTVEANIEKLSNPSLRSPNQLQHDVLSKAVRSAATGRQYEMSRLLDSLEMSSISEQKRRRRDEKLRKVQVTVTSKVAAVEEKVREYHTSKSVLRKIYDALSSNEGIRNETVFRDRELILSTTGLRAKLLMDLHVDLSSHEVGILMSKFDEHKTGYLNLYNVYGNAKLICGTPPKKKMKKKMLALSQTQKLPQGYKKLPSGRNKVILPKLESAAVNAGKERISTRAPCNDSFADDASADSTSSVPVEQVLMKLADFASRQLKNSRSSNLFGSSANSIRMQTGEFKHFLQDSGVAGEISAREITTLEKKYSSGSPSMIDAKTFLADLKEIGRKRAKERDQELAIQSFIRVLSRESVDKAFKHSASKPREQSPPPAVSFDDLVDPLLAPGPELGQQQAESRLEETCIQLPHIPEPVTGVIQEDHSPPIDNEDVSFEASNVETETVPQALEKVLPHEQYNESAGADLVIAPFEMPTSEEPALDDRTVLIPLREMEQENKAVRDPDPEPTEILSGSAVAEIIVKDFAAPAIGPLEHIDPSATVDFALDKTSNVTVEHETVESHACEEQQIENLPYMSEGLLEAGEDTVSVSAADTDDTQYFQAEVGEIVLGLEMANHGEKDIASIEQNDEEHLLPPLTNRTDMESSAMISMSGSSDLDDAMDQLSKVAAYIQENSAKHFAATVAQQPALTSEVFGDIDSATSAPEPPTHTAVAEPPAELYCYPSAHQASAEKISSISAPMVAIMSQTVDIQEQRLQQENKEFNLPLETDKTFPYLDSLLSAPFEVESTMLAEFQPEGVLAAPHPIEEINVEIAENIETIDVLSEPNDSKEDVPGPLEPNVDGDSGKMQKEKSFSYLNSLLENVRSLDEDGIKQPNTSAALDTLYLPANEESTDPRSVIVEDGYANTEAVEPALSTKEFDATALDVAPFSEPQLPLVETVKDRLKNSPVGVGVDPFELLSRKINDLYSDGSNNEGSAKSIDQQVDESQLQSVDEEVSVTSKGYVSSEKNIYDSHYLNAPPPSSLPPPESPVTAGAHEDGTYQYDADYHYDGSGGGEEYHGYYAEDGTWVSYEHSGQEQEWTQEQIDEYYRQHPEEYTQYAHYQQGQDSSDYSHYDAAASEHYDPAAYYDPNAEYDSNVSYDQQHERGVDYTQYGSSDHPGDDTYYGQHDGISENNYSEEAHYTPGHEPDPNTSEYYNWEQAHRPTTSQKRAREYTGESLPGIYSESDVMQRTASGYSINPLAGTGTSAGLNIYGGDESEDDHDEDEAVNEFSAEMDPFSAIGQPILPMLSHMTSFGTDADVVLSKDYDKLDNRILYGGDTTDTDNEIEAGDNFNSQFFGGHEIAAARRSIPDPAAESPSVRNHPDYLSPNKSFGSIKSTSSMMSEPLRRINGGSTSTLNSFQYGGAVDNIELGDYNDDSASYYY